MPIACRRSQWPRGAGCSHLEGVLSAYRPGDEVDLDVLGLGRVTATVATVDELVQEGVRGLAWRVVLVLPDGSRAHGIERGAARLAFLDPRHRVA